MLSPREGCEWKQTKGTASMKSDWILDVIQDLSRFARKNELLILAEQLDDVALVALSEIGP